MGNLEFQIYGYFLCDLLNIHWGIFWEHKQSYYTLWYNILFGMLRGQKNLIGKAFF